MGKTMNLEESITPLYLRLESILREVLGSKRLRSRGFASNLTDVEVLTLEIFGEWQGHHDEKAIYRYALSHWKDWFPSLPTYQNFRRQCANLRWLKQAIVAQLWPSGDISVIDECRFHSAFSPVRRAVVGCENPRITAIVLQKR
jgi:hypothetical protein